jgi:hypothetical protein
MKERPSLQEQRKGERQEVRGEEWSEGDEVRTALVFYGRWAGIATREECLAVEHRGSDRDTTRAVQAEAQKEVTCATA